MSFNKIVTLVIWILGIGAFFYPAESTAVSVLRGVVIFLVVAHIIEIAVFWKVLKQAPGSLGGHIFNTFLFGVFHVGPLKKAQQASLS
jgi:uncharacterized protein YhhL (DUF1145 family)